MVRGMRKQFSMRGLVWLLVTLFALTACMEATAQVRRGRGNLLKELDEAFVEIWNQVGPAVVNVDTEREISVPEVPPFFRDWLREFGMRMPEGGERSRKVEGRGSGFVIDKEGHILTNFHVIESADTIKVRFSEREQYEAKVVGTDRRTDIALIKIDANKDLPMLALGDSDALRVGQIVMAIGNPTGTLDRTFTVGHVSGLGRVLWQFQERMPYQSFIQTDAAINLGNSGGPLVNVDGEVVGINTAMAAFAENIGFAVPISYAKDILPDLKESGKAVRGFLGVTVRDLPPGTGKEYGLPNDKGAQVQDVTADSPAEKAGLKTYDVITEVEGQKIESAGDLVEVITHFRPGTTVRVTYFRDGKKRAARVKLAELPEAPGEQLGAPGVGVEETLGMTVEPVTPEMKERLQLDVDAGVIVTDVEPGGVAASAGVRPADVVVEVNRRPVKSVTEFSEAVEAVKSGDWVVLLLNRENQRLIVHIKKP